jgi:EAL domain-containing protein (putative c-di-GMP-specific phosphodiesterase class I)
LNTLNLAPGSLRLELAEALVYEGQTQVAQLLDAMRSKGVSIALDDFGRGLSNPGRLKGLPISTVRIRRELMKSAVANPRAEAMLRSMVSPAREMKLAVIAKGVDTEAELQAAMMLGCDFAQGNLFGAPMSASDAQRFIAMNWNVEPPARSKSA